MFRWTHIGNRKECKRAYYKRNCIGVFVMTICYQRDRTKQSQEVQVNTTHASVASIRMLLTDRDRYSKSEVGDLNGDSA